MSKALLMMQVVPLIESECERIVVTPESVNVWGSIRLHRSFIQNENKRGPRMEPCGAPVKIIVKGKNLPFKSNNCDRSICFKALYLKTKIEWFIV